MSTGSPDPFQDEGAIPVLEREPALLDRTGPYPSPAVFPFEDEVPVAAGERSGDDDGVLRTRGDSHVGAILSKNEVDLAVGGRSRAFQCLRPPRALQARRRRRGRQEGRRRGGHHGCLRPGGRRGRRFQDRKLLERRGGAPGHQEHERQGGSHLVPSRGAAQASNHTLISSAVRITSTFEGGVIPKSLIFARTWPLTCSRPSARTR